mgnify:CR=1 FL=1
MSKTLNIAVATAGVVIAANAVEDKSFKPTQLLAAGVYIVGLAAINTANVDLAYRVALLVLVGVILTRGLGLMQKLNVNG